MLSIALVAAVAYYVGFVREDYYVKGAELAGQWWGKAAAILGFAGEVTRETLANALRGFSPDGTKALVQNAGRQSRQNGWDLTFSPAKSVSVLRALAPEPYKSFIDSAHHRAVRHGLDFLEREAAFTRRGKSGDWERVGLVVAVLFHETSRANEPQIHSHCLVGNLTARNDGTTGTILSKPIYQRKMEAGAVYRTELARILEHELGLELIRAGDRFEIKGIPKSLCDALSTRRKEIVTDLAEKGIYSASAAKISALATRRKKEAVDHDTLVAVWRETAKSHGFGPREAELLFPRRELAASKASPEKTAVKVAESDKPISIHEPSTANRSKEQPEQRHEAASQSSKTPERSPAPPVREKRADSRPSDHRSSALRRPLADRFARILGVFKFHFNRRSIRGSAYQARFFGRVLARIPFTPFEIRLAQNRPFRNVPAWNPLKKLAVPIVLVRSKDVPAFPSKYALTPPIWEKAIGPIELKLHSTAAFPRAPHWSPLSKISKTVLRVDPHIPETLARQIRRAFKTDSERTKKLNRPNLELTR